MPLPRGLLTWLAVLAAVIALFGSVEASEEKFVERQNPSFITRLPTSASSPVVVVVTTTSVSTVVPPPQVPTTSQAPLQTLTPTANPSPTTFLKSSSTLLTTAAPSPTVNASEAANQDPFSTVGDTFFGRVPTVDPDAPIISIFLVIFLLFAIAHWLYYRASGRRSKWAPKAYLSRLVAMFCLARVATCTLRLIWIAFPRSAVVISVADITDNAGTILLVVLNFHLTKRMISFCNLKYSLWARSVTSKVCNVTVGIMFTTIFLLNAFGVALFEVQVTSGRDPTTEEHLVQASKALILLFSLLFNIAVFFTMVTFSWAPVERLTVKTITYILGAGLLTLISQLIRLIAAFMIWKPVNHLSEKLLSKPAYYIAGFGAEVLIIILYGFWETNLLALTRASFFPCPKAPSDRSATQSPESGSLRPPSSSSTTQILQRMSSASTKEKDGHVAGDQGDNLENKLKSTVISSPPVGVRDEDNEKVAGSAKPGAITVRKEFTISTTRVSTTIGKAI